MTAVLSEILDFDQFLNNVISDLWVNCKYQNDILKCFLVYFNYLTRFEVESKFCQKLKLFMTADLSEISYFDHFLNIFISDLWVNCKCQNHVLKYLFVVLNHLWKFDVESKFWWPRSLATFQIFTTFWSFSFLICESISSVKIILQTVFFLLIWTICESLRLNQNFVKNWKFWWPRSLAKFQILTTFWTLSFLICEWIASIKMIL